MELTKQIREVVGAEEFKGRIEKKYGHKVVGHHQEQGIGVYELDNGDEIKFWDEKKLIGNPFGRRGKDNKIPAHFTKTKYSEWGYKAKGTDKFVTNYRMKIEGAGTLAFAKSIGLTPAQIRKAENEGVGNSDDIREALRMFASRTNQPEGSVAQVPKWVTIEPKGKPEGDNYYGYSNKSKLEETLAEVKSHIGEKVVLSGGGGGGSNYAVLKGAHIEEFPMRIKGEDVMRWGLKVDLRLDEPIFGSHDFDPWLDSWQIAVQRNDKATALSEYNKEVAKAKKAYTDILRETGSHEKAFQVENKITMDAQRRYEGNATETELQSIESSRSLLSQSSDESQEHSLVLEPDDPRVEVWKRDQGRADVRGIDTPKGKTKKHTRKSKKSNPTTMRELR